VSEGQVFPVPAEWAEKAHMDAAAYEAACQRVEADPEGFWREVAGRLDWIKPFTTAKDVSFDREDFHIRWFADGVLNVSANCLDRHLPHRANDVAIIWEGDNPEHSRKITYAEAHAETCRMANVLKIKGVKKGDRVTIYMPMIPEAAFAMLACSRIGAVHSVIFGGFSPDSIAGRVQDCQSTFIITADEGMRGGKVVPLKANVDQALTQCPDVTDVLVVRNTGAKVFMKPGRDHAYDDERAKVSADCPPEPASPRACCTPPAAI
jgi:acetyl-CoA synthetase